jgi:hypothetical protein
LLHLFPQNPLTCIDSIFGRQHLGFLISIVSNSFYLCIDDEPMNIDKPYSFHSFPPYRVRQHHG